MSRCLKFSMFDNSRKKCQNIFFTGKFAFFFQKFVFKNLLDFFKIWSFYFRSETQITSWTLTKCSLRFVVLDNSIIWEKKAKIFFSLERLPFFSKFCVFKQPLRCYRIDLISSTVIVGLPFGALQTVPGVLSPSIIREKKAKTFFHWKDWLFFSKLCVFQQLLRCYRSDVITSTVIVGTPFGHFQNVPWGLSHSIIREKMPKAFFHWKVCLFIQKFVFHNLSDFLKFDLITSAVKLKLPLGLLQSVVWDLSYSITRL